MKSFYLYCAGAAVGSVALLYMSMNFWQRWKYMAIEGNYCHRTTTSHKTGPTKPLDALHSHLATMFSFTPLMASHNLCVDMGKLFFSFLCKWPSDHRKLNISPYKVNTKLCITVTIHSYCCFLYKNNALLRSAVWSVYWNTCCSDRPQV